MRRGLVCMCCRGGWGMNVWGGMWVCVCFFSTIIKLLSMHNCQPVWKSVYVSGCACVYIYLPVFNTSANLHVDESGYVHLICVRADGSVWGGQWVCVEWYVGLCVDRFVEVWGWRRERASGDGVNVLLAVGSLAGRVCGCAIGYLLGCSVSVGVRMDLWTWLMRLDCVTWRDST